MLPGLTALLALSGEPTCGAPRGAGSLCCFRNADVRVHRAQGSGSAMLVVDGFFCPTALASLLELAAASYDSGAWVAQDAFPGSTLDMGGGDGGGGEVGSAIARQLVGGGYLNCVADAVRVAGLAGRVPFDALDRPDAAAAAAAAAAGAGSTAGGAASEAAAAWRSGDMRLANTFRPYDRNFVHVDSENLVTNVHLSPLHNRTGTSFWRSKRHPAVYGVGDSTPYGEEEEGREALEDLEGQRGRGREEEETAAAAAQTLARQEETMRAANVALEAFPSDMSFNDQVKVAAGSSSGKRPRDYAGRVDATGVFEHADAVPYRLNRLLAYSGHLFHSPLVEEVTLGAANGGAAMDADPRLGRVFLQEFRRSPGLAVLAKLFKALSKRPDVEYSVDKRQTAVWKAGARLGCVPTQQADEGDDEEEEEEQQEEQQEEGGEQQEEGREEEGREDEDNFDFFQLFKFW
jgi:hypothetical protein